MIALADSPSASPAPSTTDRIEELQATVSASKLNLWQTCRLKFFFRYVLRIKHRQTPARYVGSLVHLVLQSWNKARWRKEPHDPAVLKQWFESKWQDQQQEEPIQWDGEEPGEKNGSWSLLETYFSQTPIPADERPEGVEVRVEADLYHHGLPKLVGVLDLVRAGGVIVDFKTTGQTPNPERVQHLHETQLSCYSVLYRECTGKKESALELHNLVKLKTPKLVVVRLNPTTQAQQTKLFKIMDSYLHGLDRQDWIPSPGPMTCAGCEYFNECRSWG